MHGPALSLSNISLSLQGNAGMIDILHDVSLEVQPQETLGLIGPSGSGKSSLLMVMAGLEAASQGQIFACGQSIGNKNEDQLAQFRREYMGVVFQSFHLIPTLTVLENVAAPLELAGHMDAFKRARHELERVGLSQRLNHMPSQLSGGEQQRVALARAAAPRPKILLADEPTGNLDEETGAKIMDLLFDLRDRHGSTLIIVTHSNELAKRCDRTVRLKNGRIDHTAPRGTL